MEVIVKKRFYLNCAKLNKRTHTYVVVRINSCPFSTQSLFKYLQKMSSYEFFLVYVLKILIKLHLQCTVKSSILFLIRIPQRPYSRAFREKGRCHGQKVSERKRRDTPVTLRNRWQSFYAFRELILHFTAQILLVFVYFRRTQGLNFHLFKNGRF